MAHTGRDNPHLLDVELDGDDQPAPGAVPPGQPPPPVGHGGGFWRWPLLSLVLVALILAPVVYLLVGSPKARARRHFLRGVALQTASRFEAAAREMEQALGLDDRLAAAGVRLGLARLHLGSPAPDVGFLKDLLQRAMRGDTGPLDQADAAFDQAIEMADRAPPGGRFPDAAQPGMAQVRANAYAGRGLTRVLRASAALGAGKADQAQAWCRDALEQARLARTSDPGNLLAPMVDSLAQLLLTYASFGDLDIF